MSAPAQTTQARPAGLEAETAEQADVIVVGAGPAGSSAAYWLARSRPRRRAAGEDDVPAREGLRRRAHPARHPRARRHGHRRQRGDGWLHNRGPAGDRRRPAPAPGLARPDDLPALRAGPPAGGPRRAARQAGRQGRRAAARAAPPSPSRCSTTPAGWSAVAGRDRRQAAGELPRAARARLRRRVRASWPSAWASTATTSGRSASRCAATTPARKTHDDYLESWLELWDGKPNDVRPAARLRLDLRHGRRHGERRARRAELERRVPEDRLPRACSPAGWTTRPRSGGCASRTRPARSAAPRCRWASTAPRTTATACCWSATPAAR